MEMYVIYDHPKDHPGHFVVRKWWIGKGEYGPSGDYTLGKSLDEVRAAVPDGLFRIARFNDDDPKIVEVWL